jgi:hypothetical protein
MLLLGEYVWYDFVRFESKYCGITCPMSSSDLKGFVIGLPRATNTIAHRLRTLATSWAIGSAWNATFDAAFWHNENTNYIIIIII